MEEDELVKGNGVQFFWDLRGSTKYWENIEDDGRLAAKFMLALKKNLFIPAANKYGLKIMGNGGDGPLFIRLRKKSETCEKMVFESIQAGIELIARYDEVKKENDLRGPENCGVGMGRGSFWFFFTKAGKKPFIMGLPTLVSKSITEAYICDQSNKEFNSSMTIAENVYKCVKNKSLRRIFEKHEVMIKKEKSFSVYTAKLDEVKKLYSKKIKNLQEQ